MNAPAKRNALYGTGGGGLPSVALIGYPSHKRKIVKIQFLRSKNDTAMNKHTTALSLDKVNRTHIAPHYKNMRSPFFMEIKN